jgi:hypothetical protein
MPWGRHNEDSAVVKVGGVLGLFITRGVPSPVQLVRSLMERSPLRAQRSCSDIFTQWKDRAAGSELFPVAMWAWRGEPAAHSYVGPSMVGTLMVDRSCPDDLKPIIAGL